MKKFKSCSRMLPWFMALLLTALLAGCGGGGDQGRDPILGTGGVALVPPTVTAVVPVNNATNVAVNNTIITAAFSKDMAPATINTSTFTLACPAATTVAGTVAYMASSRVAMGLSDNMPPPTAKPDDTKARRAM